MRADWHCKYQAGLTAHSVSSAYEAHTLGTQGYFVTDSMEDLGARVT